MLSSLPFPASAAPKPELKELRGRIDALQKELDSKEGAKADASDALKTSERAISDINYRLRDLSTQQQGTSATLSSLEQQKGNRQQRIAAEQVSLGKLLYQQYLSGQQDQFKILLNQQNPNQAARQLRYYGYLARARNEMLENLRDNLAKLQQLSQATESKQAELARIRAEQDQQKQQLVAQQQAKKKLVAQLAQQIGRQRTELSQLQRNEKQLTQLIERLAKQQARKKPERTPRRNAREPAAEQPVAPQPSALAQTQKGKLPLPVRGELAGRFGSPRQDSGAPWRGVFIRTAAGQEVHNIAEGRVVFADWLRGFGNLIIIDHGNGYMSLYGNNESLFKHVGDNVRSGDVIASTGNSGGNPETGLYFELRFQSRPFDPLTWCRAG
ncbi:murein hydrolase activator EnvC family protein [Sulfurimicrobium lacus]|uniref:murein hydrolase activator EnvC family protein n=1 Tax=Sulfurimicrobium lacus TaxID=2715678 RepID=UPI001563B334|nr:peptidoglycan DD-metalloendopeptidase family protein [Sulfurimicrobium lacus]